MIKEKEMIDLPSHSYFEQLLGRGESTEESLPPLSVIYFTAKWCKKCQSFDLQNIMSALPNATWYKNDIDENENTYAYCSLRSIPSFVVIKEKKYMGSLSKTTEEGAIEWLKQFV
jgi:thiol-disulfide isomerase/thioredoxin